MPPYIPKAEPEPRWVTRTQLLALVEKGNPAGVTSDECWRQIAHAIADGNLGVRWADEHPPPAGPVTWPADVPSRARDYWLNVDINRADPDQVREPPLYDRALVNKRQAARLDRTRRYRTPLFDRVAADRWWLHPRFPADRSSGVYGEHGMEKPIAITEAIETVAQRLAATSEQAWAGIKSEAFCGRLSLEGIDDQGRPCAVERHWLPYIEPWGTDNPPPSTVPGKPPITSDMPRRDGGSMIAFDRARAGRDRRADERDGLELRSVPPIRLRDLTADGRQIDDLWSRAEYEFKSADWSLGNVLSWIAFNDPVLICEFDSWRDLVARRMYGHPSSNRLPWQQMLVPDADHALLDALKGDRLSAIRNGAEIPSTYWFGKYIRDLTSDLRFRRSEVLDCRWAETSEPAPGTRTGASLAQPPASMRNVEPAADIEPPERPARSRRRNEKRPEIAQAIAILAGSVEWETSPDGRRCKLVEQHLNKPSGWVKLRTLRRAIADRESMPSQ